MWGRLGQVKSHIRPFSLLRSMSQIYAPSQTHEIRNAGILIIGDEILTAKTFDTNSAWFAKYCFDLGIDLKRIEVIPDEKKDIIEAVTRMSKNYDMVVTSGGVGPTHDDITYESVAEAFDLLVRFHPPTWQLMKKISKKVDWSQPDDTPEQLARRRMAEFPMPQHQDPEAIGDATRKPGLTYLVNPDAELWVPIVVVNGNVHIVPGIPRLFTGLISGIRDDIASRVPAYTKQERLLVFTKKPESQVAAFLTGFQKEVESQGVKLGSYPKWQLGVVVSLIGRDKGLLEQHRRKVMEALDGTPRSLEEEEQSEQQRRQAETNEIKK